MSILGFLGGAPRSEVASSDITPAEARKRQETGALLIDVRESDEWRAGHAPSARHIPLGQLAGHLARLPKDREILFVCASGGRSGAATSLARRAGLEKALNVRGGMLAWARAGLPTIR
jgi:rhodanese-related sulfurtransferase